MSLYEKEIYALDKAINSFIELNPEVELTAEIVKEIIGSVDCDIKQKAENICKYVKTLEFNIELCKSETSRISNMKNSYSKRIELLKEYLLPYVLEKGKQDLGTFKISSRKSARVSVLDEELVPCDWKRNKTTTTVDKEALKKYLADGYKVTGVELTYSNNLQIK